MIRFACGTCGSALRAPAAMAGKRGRCARCGKVNQVPVVLSVDVRRSAADAHALAAQHPAVAARGPALVATAVAVAEAAGSPFRSTADLLGRSATVEGPADLSADPPFRTAPLDRDDLGDRTLDFFDQVAARINNLAEPADPAQSAARVPDRLPARPQTVVVNPRVIDSDDREFSDENDAEDDPDFLGGDADLPLADLDLAPRPKIDLRRVIVTALTVGAICGFCLGLVAAHWVL